MGRDYRREALRQLLDLAAVKGYVTFDDIFSTGDQYAFSVGDYDWLSNSIVDHNVLLYESEPEPTVSDGDDFDDYAQKDYEITFQAVHAQYPDLAPLIDDIRSIKPPQRGEVSRLKHQVKEGNQYARQRMIEMYLRVALRIAYARSRDYDTDLEETIGDAFVGLITAVDKYDPDHSGPFVSYASMWIYQNITREQRPQNTNLYFPAHRKGQYYSAYPLLKRRGCTECAELPECNKAREMVQVKIDGDEDQVEDVITASLCALPLHRVAKELRRCDYIYETTGEKVCCVDERLLWYSDEDLIHDAGATLLRERLMDRLDTLPERTEQILRARWGLDDGQERTLEEVGQMFGLTRERIRQIEAKALKKLEAGERAYRARITKQRNKADKTQQMINNWEAIEESKKALGKNANDKIEISRKKRGRPRKKR